MPNHTLVTPSGNRDLIRSSVSLAIRTWLTAMMLYVYHEIVPTVELIIINNKIKVNSNKIDKPQQQPKQRSQQTKMVCVSLVPGCLVEISSAMLGSWWPQSSK